MNYEIGNLKAGTYILSFIVLVDLVLLVCTRTQRMQEEQKEMVISFHMLGSLGVCLNKHELT